MEARRRAQKSDGDTHFFIAKTVLASAGKRVIYLFGNDTVLLFLLIHNANSQIEPHFSRLEFLLTLQTFLISTI